MKSIKHILLITPGFPADENDTTCLPMIQEYLKGFLNLHPEIIFTVVSLHYPYQTNPYLWKGINVIPLGGSNVKGFGKLMLWRRAIKKVYDVSSDKQFDLVHSLWLAEASIVAIRAAKKFSIPCISTLMGQDVLPENNYLPFIDFDHLNLVALCERQADELWKTAGRKVNSVIPWGIPEQNFNSTKERSIDILGVGSLIPLKNFSLFISIINRLVENFPDLKTEIIGEGIEREHLAELITKLNLEKNVKLTGVLPHTEIMQRMQNAKILMHTSTYEGFGYVFAEALSNGMYVVSKNVGAANKSEKWMIAENELEFSSAIQNLLNSKMIFEAANIFSIDKTVDSYYNFYNEILK